MIYVYGLIMMFSTICHCAFDSFIYLSLKFESYYYFRFNFIVFHLAEPMICH